MDEELTVDPRTRRLAPTQEERDAWALAEQARRQAWMRGPTEFEKHEWFRQERRKAALGLGDSYVAPTSAEIEAWSERERRRRVAWLEGPSEKERHDWMRRHARRAEYDVADSDDPTAVNAVEEWAQREHQRRHAWLAGPTEQEKTEWARRQTENLAGRLQHGFESERELVSSILREAEVAGRGSIRALTRASAALWSYIVRAGESPERDSSAPPRRSRVPY
jgi:hypothetical protein